MRLKPINITGNYFPYAIYIKAGNNYLIDDYLFELYGKEYIGYINTTGIWFRIGRYVWFKHQSDRDQTIKGLR